MTDFFDINQTPKAKNIKEKGIEQQYTCGYCLHKFKMTVRQSNGEKHSRVSTQVKCPNCQNFLKTWPEEK